MKFRVMRELTTVQGWELFWALIFHNFTILLAAWVGFVVGARMIELDHLESAQEEGWRQGGS